MSITICFDFGNTRKKVAVFRDAELKEALTLADDETSTIQNLVDRFKPDKSILSSVIEHNPAIEDVLKKKGVILDETKN